MSKENEFDTLEKGVIRKSANIEVQEVTDGELAKINQYTLEPLKAEEVFTFKVIAGDNELDDRNFEPFNLKALKDLKKMYPGKTVIKDHRRTADNQVARIYDAELVETEGKTTDAGEQSTQLLLKCYMVKTDSNADLITEIKAGIKKEVSTGFRSEKAICSICGTDNAKSWCSHYPGVEYGKEDGKHVCYFTLDGVKDAYELSLVAVPAQPRAGACKNFGVDEPKEAPEQAEEKATDEPIEPSENEEANKVLTLQLEGVGAFIFAKKQKNIMEGNT